MRKLRVFLLIAIAFSVFGLAITPVANAGNFNNRFNFTVVDEGGVAIGSNKVVVKVYLAGTSTLAPLYTSTNGDSDAEHVAGTLTSSTGDFNFYAGSAIYDFLIYDSPVVTSQIKRTSITPTTHNIMFPLLATYSPGKIIGGLRELVDSDTQPVIAGSFYKTNTTTATINNFCSSYASEGGLSAGQILVVQSKGAITFDVTSSGLIGGSTDIVTAAGDITTWIYDGTSWSLMSYMDLSDDLN